MPNEESENEIEAINSIYGDQTLISDSDSGDVYILNLPNALGSLRLKFPENYPDAPPEILGTQSSGEHKGDASRLLETFRDTLGRLFVPGEVCLFDVLEEIVGGVESHDYEEGSISEALDGVTATDVDGMNVDGSKTPSGAEPEPEPKWVISDAVKEKTSVFIAHATRVESVRQAEEYLEHLLATDKKVGRASHNMTAWRIKGPGENGVVYQDCDDDGESAAGGRLLHLMQVMDLWNVMVVVSRWFDGTHIGSDRFRLINIAARDAFVKGNFIEEPPAGSVKKKGKK